MQEANSQERAELADLQGSHLQNAHTHTDDPVLRAGNVSFYILLLRHMWICLHLLAVAAAPLTARSTTHYRDARLGPHSHLQITAHAPRMIW